MDNLTRGAIIISAILLGFLVLTLSWNRAEMTPRVWQLNELLEEDPGLAQYPYRFRVVLFLNGVATLTSPHGDRLPLEAFLKTVDPGLADKPAGAPELAAAEARFREHEQRAIQVMLSQPDVQTVLWSLDRAWYHDHKIKLVDH